MILNGLIVAAGTTVAIAVALLSDSWRKNRQERSSTSCDLHRDNIRRALDASRTYTGRAWTESDLVARVASRGEAGASRVSGAVKVDLRDHSNPVKVDRSRNLSDARLPLRVVDGRQTPRGSTRAHVSSATSTRGRLPADPRNTNARAHGTGVR